MTHVLESARVDAGLMHFEYLQKAANRTVANVELVMGVDEAKRFEADIAKCVNGTGDVASKTERLQEVFQAIGVRMKASLEEKGEVTRQLTEQLQACAGVAFEPMGTWDINKLGDDAKQQAVKLALMLAAHCKRLSEATDGDGAVLDLAAEGAHQEKAIFQDAMQRLAALADSTKASLDAADKASARSDSALRTANEKIAQLEKEASVTSEIISQAVRDLQKLAYEKDDPERPASSKIQQKPLACLESTVQALKQASEGKGADGDAPSCLECKARKAKLDDLDATLLALVKENSKMLDEKKDLLADRQRDKDEVNRLSQQMANLRTEIAETKPKKRNK